KTIAMVGASPDPTKFSYGVLRVLHETGYDMIPVNPHEAGGEIRGLRVYESLAAIDRPVDMVQVFRSSEALLGITREAIEIAAKDAAATPVEIVLAGLASCLTAGVAAVAQARKVQLRSVSATLEAGMDVRGILGMDEDIRNGFDGIKVTYKIDADASPADIKA